MALPESENAIIPYMNNYMSISQMYENICSNPKKIPLIYTTSKILLPTSEKLNTTHTTQNSKCDFYPLLLLP